MRAGSGCRCGACARARRGALEPALAPTLRLALEVPDDHVIDPHALTAALERRCVRAGGELRAGCEVAEVRCSRRPGRAVFAWPRATQVARRAGRDRRRRVVVVDRREFRRMRGCRCARSRARSLRLHDPSGPGLLTRVLRMSPGYVVPRGDGRYVLGATMEERGFDTTITAGAIFELLRDAIELVPGIGELVIDGLVGRAAAGHSRQRPRARPGRARRAALGDGPLPSRDLARADHSRCARGRACRRARCRRSRRRSARQRFAGVAVGA